jgi:hypothetical protein
MLLGVVLCLCAGCSSKNPESTPSATESTPQAKRGRSAASEPTIIERIGADAFEDNTYTQDYFQLALKIPEGRHVETAVDPPPPLHRVNYDWVIPWRESRHNGRKPC